MRFSTRARSRGFIRGHGPCLNARVAAATARSMSSFWPAAACTYVSLETGSSTPKVLPETLSTNAPSMKCWIFVGRFSGTWWVDTAADSAVDTVCCDMRGLLSMGGSVLLVLVLVRVQRVQGRQPVAPCGELDLQRVRAGFDQREDVLVLVDGFTRAARHEAERGVAQHGQAVP